MNLILFTEKNSSRLHYAATEIAVRLGLNLELITTDQEEFKSKSGVKINYSNLIISDSFQILPIGLLFEESINKKNIDWFEFENTSVFFKTPSHDLPFDIFSCVFFFLSRYEEYYTYSPDIHGRFSAKNSVLLERNLFEKPLVEIYCIILKQKLMSRFPNANFNERTFSALFTFDIDNAWAYKNKSNAINILSSIKDFINGNRKNIRLRKKVLKDEVKDPYDTYDYIFDRIKSEKLKSVFFFLLGDRSKYDKNISWNRPELQKLINQSSFVSSIGIHPSYASYQNKERVKLEINRLKSISQKSILNSRQHFLKFNLPESFLIIDELGIESEYSMGFADKAGFRASTCLPFNFFNLKTNTSHYLKCIPLTVMDGTLNEYESLSVEQAKDKSFQLINEIKTVKGIFVTLWHNETLNDMGKWKDWRSVFEYQVLLAKN